MCYMIVKLSCRCEYHSDALNLANAGKRIATVSSCGLSPALDNKPSLEGLVLLDFVPPLRASDFFPTGMDVEKTSS